MPELNLNNKKLNNYTGFILSLTKSIIYNLFFLKTQRDKVGCVVQ